MQRSLSNTNNTFQWDTFHCCLSGNTSACNGWSTACAGGTRAQWHWLLGSNGFVQGVEGEPRVSVPCWTQASTTGVSGSQITWSLPARPTPAQSTSCYFLLIKVVEKERGVLPFNINVKELFSPSSPPSLKLQQGGIALKYSDVKCQPSDPDETQPLSCGVWQNPQLFFSTPVLADKRTQQRAERRRNGVLVFSSFQENERTVVAQHSPARAGWALSTSPRSCGMWELLPKHWTLLFSSWHQNRNYCSNISQIQMILNVTVRCYFSLARNMSN